VAARRLVRMLKDSSPSLIVLALCDYDPWGLQILCTYAFGSMVHLDLSNNSISSLTQHITFSAWRTILRAWPLLSCSGKSSSSVACVRVLTHIGRLGVHDEDLKTWELPAGCFSDLTTKDMHKGQLMMNIPAIQAKPTWRCVHCCASR
jgi:hypothetical protein